MATGSTNEDNRVYLFRLQILIIDGGLLLLRSILDQKLFAQGITFSACLNNEKATITSLRSRGKVTQAQYDILFPSGGGVPTTLDLDITLIICLLRNLKCVGLNKKFKWNVAPMTTDLSLEADIWRLKDNRNNICHVSTTTGIQQNDFTTRWNDIEQILVRQSPAVLNIQQTIAYFKTCPLDAEEEKRIQKEIEKWEEYEVKVNRLQEEFYELKHEVNELKTRQDIADVIREEGISVQTEEENYEDLRKHLRDDLINFYRRRHSKVQLSPLFEEKDTPLATFYIRPEINVKTPRTKNETHQTPGTQDEMHRIKSLSDMFRPWNEVNGEIYLTADAGFEKTTFSKYLATSWCQAHYPEEKDKTSFEKEDIDCMRKFEFVFLVLLRDSNNLCSTDDLIFELIVSTLAHSEKFDKGFLQEILNREICLVILDGLDEWTHPENPVKPCYRTSRYIPHRNYRDKCTVLTTTRPWKLGILNLSSNELGIHVILTKLSNDSAYTLAKRTLQRLKSLPDEDSLEEEVDRFIDRINAKDNEDLSSVPLLLIYIICLWCDGVEISNSDCELYVNIVELLLSRMIAKYEDLQLSRRPIETFLECFTGHDNCTKYFPFLMNLGKLAHHTLFNENRESTLVFDGSVARTYLKEDDMKLSLLSGILTESTANTITKRISKVSFSHKTVQEFFAAIFLSSQKNGQETVLEKCKSAESFFDMYTVCQFISRMNAAMMPEISEGFLSVMNGDVITREYRTNTDEEDIDENFVFYIQVMLVSWLNEMSESENIQLCIHDLIIDDSTGLTLQSMSKLNKNYIKSLHINSSGTSSSLREIIELHSLSNLNYLQKLYYEGNLKEAEISCLLSPSLQTLSLLSGKWTNCKENLKKRLEQIQNLQYLYIYEFTFSHEILETFFKFISSTKTLKKVKLQELYCNEHGNDCERMRLDLSKNTLLTQIELVELPSLQLNITSSSVDYVRLEDINLGEDSLLLSPEMLNIKRMVFESVNLSESLQNNLKVLENLPHSVMVVMHGYHTELACFEDYIRQSETFQVTRDNYICGKWRFEFNTGKQ